MTGWIIAGAVVLLVFLLLWTDLVLAVQLEDSELSVRFRYGPVSLPVYPQPDKPQKPARKAALAKKHGRRKKKKATQKPPAQPVRKKKGDMGELWQIICSLLPPLGTLLTSIRITRLQIQLVVGGTDAADTAIRYGQTCALVHGSVATLSGMMQVQIDRIEIGWDYLHAGITEKVSLELRLRLGIIVAQALRALWRLIMAIVGTNGKASAGPESGKSAASENHTGGITNG